MVWPRLERYKMFEWVKKLFKKPKKEFDTSLLVICGTLRPVKKIRKQPRDKKGKFMGVK